MYATLASSTTAVKNARRLALSSLAQSKASVSEQSLLVHQICAEAGIWAPDAASRALEQSGGELGRAVALVRVWAATLPYAEGATVSEDDIEITRHLSAAYAEIPGGQWLGPSDEQAPRLLTWPDQNDVTDVEAEHRSDLSARTTSPRANTSRRSDVRRVRDLIGEDSTETAAHGDGPDPTRAALTAPFTRLGRLAALARSETGALVSFSSVVMESRREAILLEINSSIVHFGVAHPRTGNQCHVSEVPIVEAEAVADTFVDGRASLVLGYGVSLGSLERRAIAIAVLDAIMQDGPITLTLDDGVIMSAFDGLSATGIVEHLRLPHYVSFAAYLSSIENEEDLEQ
jgi:alpha-D-ribose 1-methylphosphonate 5-triphosphate synthase subunit PhnI